MTLPVIEAEKQAGVGSAIWTGSVSEFNDLTFLVLPRLAGNSTRPGASRDPGIGTRTAMRWPRTAESGNRTG